MTSQPDPKDGPPDDWLDRVLNDQALREAAVKASRQAGNCPVRSESHINAHEDRRVMAILSVFADALRVLPPEGGPRPEFLVISPGEEEEYCSLCHAGRDGDCEWEHCPQRRDGEPVRSGRHCPLDFIALRASGAGTRQEEPQSDAWPPYDRDRDNPLPAPEKLRTQLAGTRQEEPTCEYCGGSGRKGCDVGPIRSMPCHCPAGDPKPLAESRPNE